MFKRPSSHLAAVIEALFVTLLWSSSWVLIKIGLAGIPALTFAGLRYGLATLCLLPFLLRPAGRAALGHLGRGDWLRLAGLGLLFYAITQGAQFVGLSYLPANTVSLLLNCTSVVVALLGVVYLGEEPTALQWGGVALYLAGVAAYFLPLSIAAGQALGFAVVIAGVLANALSSVLGRQVNRTGDLSPLVVTAASMGIGAALLLGAGLAAQGLPPLTLTHWAIIAWLAVVNTALAFSLWNHTLRTLQAMESSIINGAMMAEIALLAWLFLGETLTARQLAGMALAAAGALIVQVRPGPITRLRVQSHRHPTQGEDSSVATR